MRRGRSWGALWALALADAVALRLLWPTVAHLTQLTGELLHPRAWVARVGADQAVGALAEAALWLAAAWLGAGLAAALAANLPGALGRGARRLAAALLPRTCYRLIAGAAGLGVLLGPVAAGATAAVPADPAPVSTGVPAPQLPASSLPAPLLPATAAPPRIAPPRTTAPPRTPAPAPVVPGHQSRPGTTGTTVTVRPGDSLWGIAAAHLPPPATPPAATPSLLGAPPSSSAGGPPLPDASDARIAAAWPRWYATNRDTIGADPDLLLPGQLLHAPEEDS